VIALDQVIALFVVAVVLIAIPGPSVLFVVSRGVAFGRRAAVATVIGNELGLLVQGAAVAIGLGAIVERSIVAFTAVKLIGSAYLIYLGVQAFRHRRRLVAALDPGSEPVSSRRSVLEGLLVGVTNPKGFLIFAAVLPQFVDTTAGPAQLQMFLLGLVCVGIAFVTDSAWALLAGTARSWFARSPRRLQRVGGGAGIVMIGLGVRLAFTGRRD
jgi:threonine/homoserine/homoserine lactone efflux protein